MPRSVSPRACARARLHVLAGALLLAAASPLVAQAPPATPGARGPGATAFTGRTLDPRTMRPAARAVVPEGGVAVPLQGDMQPVVEVRINGQGPFRFAVATIGPTELAPRTLERLGLRASAQGTQLATVAVDSIDVGGAVLHGVLAVAPEALPGPTDGILGLATLAGMLVTLDFPGGLLQLAGGALPAPDGASVLPLVPAGRFWGVADVLGIEVDVGGRRVPAVLNALGPGMFGTVPARLGEVPLAGEPAVVGLAVTGFGAVPVRAARLAADVRVGAHTFERPLLNVLAVPEQLPSAFSIGAQALRQLAITFDQANRRVRLARASTAPIPAPPAVRSFGFDAVRRGASLVAVRVMPGSAAERAGVREGDEIVRVDGTAASALAPGAWSALRARTTPVAFELARDGATRTLTLAATTLVP
jgi:hypothetical protein